MSLSALAAVRTGGPASLRSLLDAVFQPGFLSSGPVRAALLTGAVVALVSGAIGVITILRGQSFAGHALGDLGTLGGSGAFLLGLAPLWGYIGAGAAVAAAMEGFGSGLGSGSGTDPGSGSASTSRDGRSRDVATGIVLGAVLGVSALLLYLDTTDSSTTGVTVTILFGSLFTVTGYTVPATVLLGILGLALITLLYRPLLLSSVSTDLAAARGVRVRALGLTFLVTLGVAVSLSSLTVGTILSPALLIGPAAAALRLTRRPARAMALAALLGLASTWIGVLLAYDSYRWPPAGDGWPVSFFVMALIFIAYLLSGLSPVARTRHRVSPAQAPALAPVPAQTPTPSAALTPAPENAQVR
jgi:zinc/manganese transport system permease protein